MENKSSTKILTNDEIEHALTTCTTGTCYSDNCPLKDTDNCITVLIMNALASGNRKLILRSIARYEKYYGQSSFLSDVESLLSEDNNG